jgi:hypothetical protein
VKSARSATADAIATSFRFAITESNVGPFGNPL